MSHSGTVFSLFLSPSIYVFLLVGRKCQAGWSEHGRGGGGGGGEVQPQLSQRLLASVSLCYKSFRDTQKGHNTFLSLFSHPSIRSSSFIIESGSSEQPICRLTRSKRERSRFRVVKHRVDKMKKDKMGDVEKKEEEVLVCFHTGIKPSCMR